MVLSLVKTSNMASITSSLNDLILRKMGVKKDLIKNRNGFTFRRNWHNPGRCRVRRLHFMRRKLCGRASVHGHAWMRHAHHGRKHGSTTTTCRFVHVKPRERRMVWVHLRTVKGLQLGRVRHRTRHHAIGHRHLAGVTCEHGRVCNGMVWHGVVLIRAVDVDGLGRMLLVVWEMFLLFVKYALNRVRHLSVP